MARAPAVRNASASSVVVIPPIPITGILTTWQVPQYIRVPTGLIAGPDSPPVTYLRRGRRLAVSTAIPTKVFTTERASAPASSQARAKSRISVTFGESFTQSGTRGEAFLVLAVTSKVSFGSLLK